MFPNIYYNSKNYSSSYTEDHINQMLLACLTSQKSSDEKQKFSWDIQPNKGASKKNFCHP